METRNSSSEGNLALWRSSASGAGGEAVAAAEGKPLRVLVVDDDGDAAELTCELLESMGHTARVAHDGPEALAVLATFPAEVVLLDLTLPSMDGYEVARRIFAGLPRPPRLIAVSGHGDDQDRRQTEEAGFSLHLVKPVEADQLEASVRAVSAMAARPRVA